MISLLRDEVIEQVSRTEFPRKKGVLDFSAPIKCFPTHTRIAGADMHSAVFADV